MFEILRSSGLDEELLALVWQNTSTVTFVTIGAHASDDHLEFSREQGFVALYLAQTYANMELDAFSKTFRHSQGFDVAEASSSRQREQTGSNRRARENSPTDTYKVARHISFHEEQPGLEVSHFPSIQRPSGFSQQPWLEASHLQSGQRPSDFPRQPDLEVVLQNRFHESQAPELANLPPVPPNVRFTQPANSDRASVPPQQSFAPTFGSQIGTDRRQSTGPSLPISFQNVRETRTAANHAEMPALVNGKTTKELGTALIMKYQAPIDATRSGKDVIAHSITGKWKSLKGTLASSSRKSQDLSVLRYSNEALTAALEEAAASGSVTLVEFCLSQGADVNFVGPLNICKSGYTAQPSCNRALVNAIEQGHVAVVEYLAAKCNTTVLSNGLSSAVEHDRPEMAKILMSRPEGAEVNITGALYTACKEDSLEWVQSLLHLGTKVSPVFITSASLRAASSNGNVDIVKLLLRHDAAIEDINGSLYAAASAGRLKVMQALAEHGANLSNGSVTIASISGHLHCLKYLIDNGADYNDGSLHMAVEHGQWDVVALHLDLGANFWTCATGAKHEFRVKSLKEGGEYSILYHLIRCPRRTAGYRAILERLRMSGLAADEALVETAVLHLDADLLKWILRNFPLETERLNALRYWYRPDGFTTKYICFNLTDWARKETTGDRDDLEVIWRQSPVTGAASGHRSTPSP